MEVDYVYREKEQMIKRIVRIGQQAAVVQVFRLICLEAPIETACLLRRQARLDIMLGVLKSTEKGGRGGEVVMADETGTARIRLLSNRE
jgi:hypothetical protein